MSSLGNESAQYPGTERYNVQKLEQVSEFATYVSCVTVSEQSSGLMN